MSEVDLTDQSCSTVASPVKDDLEMNGAEKEVPVTEDPPPQAIKTKTINIKRGGKSRILKSEIIKRKANNDQAKLKTEAKRGLKRCSVSLERLDPSSFETGPSCPPPPPPCKSKSTPPKEVSPKRKKVGSKPASRATRSRKEASPEPAPADEEAEPSEPKPRKKRAGPKAERKPRQKKENTRAGKGQRQSNGNASNGRATSNGNGVSPGQGDFHSWLFSNVQDPNPGYHVFQPRSTVSPSKLSHNLQLHQLANVINNGLSYIEHADSILRQGFQELQRANLMIEQLYHSNQEEQEQPNVYAFRGIPGADGDGPVTATAAASSEPAEPVVAAVEFVNVKVEAPDSDAETDHTVDLYGEGESQDLPDQAIN